jgi:hypothetical protein
MSEEMDLDAQLDEALDTLPQEPLPPHFVEGVMARIERHPAAELAPEPRFRIRPADFLAPSFITLIIITTALLAAAGLERGILPPPGDLLATYPGFLLIALVVAAELGLAAVAAFWLFEE